MSLASSPPKVNKFGPGTAAGLAIRAPSLQPLTANRASSTPRVSLLSKDEAPVIPLPIAPSPPTTPSSPQPVFYQETEKFLKVSPTHSSSGYAIWIRPGVYESVEETDLSEFPLTVRLKQKLSPGTVSQLQELFKSSWYEPRGVHGVQTDSMERALERFLVAHYLEEGKRSYEEIRQMKLLKQVKENRTKFETLIQDSQI